MSTFEILAIVAIAVLTLILAGRFDRRAGRHRAGAGDPGTWVPSMSAGHGSHGHDGGHAGCDASGSSGGDCGGSH